MLTTLCGKARRGRQPWNLGYLFTSPTAQMKCGFYHLSERLSCGGQLSERVSSTNPGSRMGSALPSAHGHVTCKGMSNILPLSVRPGSSLQRHLPPCSLNPSHTGAFYSWSLHLSSGPLPLTLALPDTFLHAHIPYCCLPWQCPSCLVCHRNLDISLVPSCDSSTNLQAWGRA